MEKYFIDEKAMAGFSGGNAETILETIASRYMGANPRHDYTARPYFASGIIRNSDYRYTADFSEIYAGADDYCYVYAWGKYRSESDGELKFLLIPKGPVKLWMNNEPVYGTTVESERYDNMPVTLNLPVKAGWNNLVLRFTKTKAGFGAEFGTWLGKLCYYFFRGLSGATADEYPGHLPLCPLLIEGFETTPPISEPLKNVTPEYLALFCNPLPSWESTEEKRGVFGRIFPQAKTGNRVMARTEVMQAVSGKFIFRGYQPGNCAIYAGRNPIKNFDKAGDFQFEHKIEPGRTALSVISVCQDSGMACWDFSLEIMPAENDGKKKNKPLALINPCFNSQNFPWIFAGPFTNTADGELAASGFSENGIFCKDMLIGGGGEKTYWRLDMPDAWVRLYNDNPLYGHWNYPLGVTLYGLIETARYFGKNENESDRALGAAIGSYVQSHGSKSVSTLEYALFDKDHFGGATAVHHLLTSIDSLDDCGSFGSLILELSKDHNIGDFSLAADITGTHILEKQDRRGEGCFWRRDMMHHFHNETLWADDLYMSVPFLCRYARYKNDPSILDIAALQFEGFKKYLYLENIKMMAHVFDFRRDINTGIPWGRGNGWTIFSLTEILMVLPENHPKREFLLQFFRELASGYLACQDENGMWHQVLNMPSSYIETSCTAMFICAFSRGIRYGWFDCDPAPYRIASEKAWQALEKYSVDRDGNIYGVCRGSEFSFNPKYYAEHLLPRLNDTHGIGIVLLAGVELLKTRNV